MSPEKLLTLICQMVQKLLSSSPLPEPTASPRKRSRGDRGDIKASIPYAILRAVALVGELVKEVGEGLTEYVPPYRTFASRSAEKAIL